MNSEEIQFSSEDNFDDINMESQNRMYENYTVMFALPLSNHDNMPLMAIAAFYALLFVVGTCGNAAILAVVHHVRGAVDHRSRHNSTLTYIVILCVADFISMLPLPMTIIDQILGFWMFGTFACKLFRLLEHIGKIFSTFVLVAFSVDRYMAVVHPLRARRNNNQMIVLVLGGTLAFTCLMLSPILLYAHSKELIIHEKYDMAQRTITKMHLFKCVDDLGDSLFIWFTIYCFILAYLFPLMAMIFFYYKMLNKLYKQARAVRQALSGRRKGMDEKIPVGHIAVYTFVICIFHFICWTPYWISVMYSLYIEIFDPSALLITPTFGFIYVMYGIHALPYINSACNFILYGMLNRQLHQTPDRKYGQMNGRNHCTAPPALRLTECSEMANNHHSTCPDSAAVRTPPSDVSVRMTEQSPLVVKREISSSSPKSSSLNGLILSSSHEQITEYSVNGDMDEESIII